METGSLTARIYPGAIDSNVLFALLIAYLKQRCGVAESQIAFATSVCSDDLNSVELPRTNMIGPFFLGGLDGFPFVGKTGIGAFAHHIPDDGLAFLFFGPHVGVGPGDVGTVIRPGQIKRSPCCGAASDALSKVLSQVPHPYDPDLDAQQLKIFQILNAKGPELRDAPADDRFVLATDILYEASYRRMEALLGSMELHGKPAIIAGGILINEDHAQGSKVSLRHLKALNFSGAETVGAPRLADGMPMSDLLPDFEQAAQTQLHRVISALHPGK